ncbi:TetR/AcrR family transcriptional regulator [Falsarthrobacter nasiphocae]|uniref:TetR/AcrR family transcriptional regulator n=1 Tax=Falsarthrobacter nasiphocae TaxID=189863 RepID=UPI0031DC9459
MRTRTTKLKLFRAAMELMGESGVTETRVEDVAARAGVSKGSIYYNFGSKSQLVEELLRFGLEQLEERIAGIRRAADSDGLEYLASVLEQGFRFLDEYPSFARLWVATSWRGAGEWAETLASLRHRVVGLVEEGLELAVPSADAATVRLTAHAIFGSVFALSLDDGQARRPSVPERVSICLLTARGLAEQDGA